MSALRRWIVSQFRRPHGLGGRLAGLIMTRRASNRRRNFAGADALDVRPGEIALELGCGPGLGLARLAERDPGLLIGIDHAPLMVATAARRLARSRPDRTALLVGDEQTALALAPAVQALLAVNVVQFMVERAAFFAALHDRLPAGARCAFVFQPRGPDAGPGATDTMEAALRDELSAAGFAVEAVRIPLARAPATCVTARKPSNQPGSPGGAGSQ